MRGLANRRTLPTSTPFDVPCDDAFIGVRHDRGTLLTVLALTANAVGPQPLTEPWRPLAYRGGAGVRGLPWDALLAWTRRPESAAAELSVLTSGRSTGDDGLAARAYRSLLGPLSVAGERCVHVAIRFAPLEHPELVARYGSGRAAPLRAALAATRTVLALLREDGLTVTGLTAAQLTDLAHQFPPDPAAAGHYIVCPDEPADLPESLESAWHYSTSASTALIWRTGPDGPSVRAVAYIGGGLDVPLCDDLPPGWHRRGGPGAGLAVASPPSGAAQALAGLVIPVTGAGIVVGADSTGRPVTLRLAGPDVPVAEVSGDLRTVQRMVVRLAGLGVSSAVFTDRPEQWDPVMDGVRDHRLVHPAATGGADVLIDDRPAGRLGPLAGHTVIRAHPDGGPVPGVPGLHVDPEDPASALVGGAGTPLRVRLVSTPAEDALLGVRSADPAR